MSHADRRYTYLRVLYRTASSSQTANYKHKTWLHTCTVLTRLSLSEQPLPSAHAVRRVIAGAGEDTVEALVEAERGAAPPNAAPSLGRYCLSLIHI